MNRLALITAGGLLALSITLMSQTQKPAPAKKPAAPAQKGPGKAAGQASMDRGKQVYLEQCLACHQADAGGVQNMNPPLVKTKWVLGDKTTLVQVVLKGMTGEVDINGDTYHNVMAPHSDLTDQQIADVLTYVRNNFGNKASAVTAAEVKAIRAKTK
jgi:mono/diheme cytochrome c family protein